MTDSPGTMVLAEPWAQAAAQISPLLQALPLPAGAPILLILQGAQAHAAVTAAAAALALAVVSMPHDSTPDGVAKAMADTQPCVVVCAPEIFGWVSKLAFLGGSLAIYTCGEDGEGTLLDRAAHCTPVRWAVPAPSAATVRHLNGQGLTLDAAPL